MKLLREILRIRHMLGSDSMTANGHCADTYCMTFDRWLDHMTYLFLIDSFSLFRYVVVGIELL